MLLLEPQLRMVPGDTVTEGTLAIAVVKLTAAVLDPAAMVTSPAR